VVHAESESEQSAKDEFEEIDQSDYYFDQPVVKKESEPVPK